MLTSEAIQEFIVIYEKKYKHKLSFEEASRKANSFYNFVKVGVSIALKEKKAG